MFCVSFVHEMKTVEVAPGTTLLEAEIAAGLTPDAPCGGMGLCGKCAVDIMAEDGSRVTVPACSTRVERDIRVFTSGKAAPFRILTDGIGRIDRVDPPVRAVQIRVEKATPFSPTSAWQRVKEAVKAAADVPIRPDPDRANGLSVALEALHFAPEAVLYQQELLDLRKEGPLLTAAVDIGTTTVVLYLADGRTGKLLATESMLNPQTKFGADVISRANYAIQNNVGLLTDAIREAVNALLACALQASGSRRENVYSLAIVGNTCMHHLFLGLDPESLVLAPYVPSIADPLVLDAKDYGILLHPKGKLFLLPCIAGFVGADTAAMMIACAFDRQEELTLAIDIGTNGEMVLGDRHRTVSCSTAAGPAFEGAKIACGMRGAEGAIDHAEYQDGQILFSVIGHGRPRGICGSGLLDLTAALLKAGVLDETGRFLDPKEMDAEAGKLEGNLRSIDSQKCFVLAEGEESADGRPIYLSQKDIREVQLAKAAMAAGISLLLDHLGKKTSDIKNVLLAGAFGSYLSPESACRIGLLPKELIERIFPVGNAAGYGALLCALDAECLSRTEKMAKETEFLELAANPGFQDRFVDELMFPERE